MLTIANIIYSSFKLALHELWLNKLRTFLSLFGITIGIFCIIGVLATLDSLEHKIQTELSSLGRNTIWIDKYNYTEGNGPNYPWWKYQKRPSLKYHEMKMLRQTSQLAGNVSYFVPESVTISYKDNELQNVNIYGITEDFANTQNIAVSSGRYLTDAEFITPQPVVVLGYDNAEKLFGTADKAIGNEVYVNKKKVTIVGVISKQGKNFIDGFDYDNSMIVSYKYLSGIFDENKAPQNLIIVQAKPNQTSTALIDELRGLMRQIRKLSPTTEDNFALNDLKQFGEQTKAFFSSVNLGGWFIAGLSLLVGAFGVANIMFVTVKERTAQIGLKKALGAKSSTILIEFLLESSFLCIIGGLIGLAMVEILSLVLNNFLPFQIYIAASNVIVALTVCIILGILSGIMPASKAAKMNPVVAIRSK